MALFLLGVVWFKAVLVRTVNWLRIGVAVLLLGLVPVVGALPALATLGVLTAVLVALLGYETHRFAEQRHQLRHETHGS